MGILSGLLAFIISLNGFIVILGSIIVGVLSNFYFGFLTLVLSFLVIVSTPRLTVFWRVRLGIPVFPGAKFFQTALLMTVVCSMVYAFLGDDLRESSKESFEVSRAQMAMRNKVYAVSPASCYWEEKNEWVVLDKEMRAISLKERKEISEEIYLKMRLEDKTGRFDGPVIWAPILRVEKSSVPSLEKDPSADNSYLPPSAKVKKEKVKKVVEALEISFSPEQVVERDFHKGVPDKLLLVLDGFMQGDTFELAKDFSFRVRGDNPESWIFIGGLKVGSPIKGEIVELKKGMRFLISNGYSNIEFCSSGEQYKFSELKIQKVL